MTLLQTCYDTLRLHPASLSFLLFVLPVFLFVYYLFPARFRPAVLLGESLLYLCLFESRWLPLLVALVVVDYGLLLGMGRLEEREREQRLCAGFGVAKSMAAFCAVMLLTQQTGAPWPVGVPVYTFSSISVLVDAYRRRIPCRLNPVAFGLYYSFFPRLYAGPMVSYGAFAGELGDVAMKPGEIVRGVALYVQGVFKMAILGGLLYRQVYLPVGELSATLVSAWLGVLSLALSLYYLLSGFSDMAQGLGRAFGISLPQNFYYPYQSRSIGDFLHRFHRSFSGFFGDILPGKNSPHPLAAAGHILLCGAFLGLWFGFGWNPLLWGLYLGLFLLMEKHLYPKLLENFPTLFSRLATLCVVLVGITILGGSSPTDSLRHLTAMFRPAVWYDDAVLYLLTSNWLLLVSSCFLATNAISLAMTKLRRAAPLVHAILHSLGDLAVLLLILIFSV